MDEEGLVISPSAETDCRFLAAVTFDWAQSGLAARGESKRIAPSTNK